MSDRIDPSNRLRKSINPVTLLRRLGEALGVDVPLNVEGIVSLPLPNTASPLFREEYLCKEILRKYPGFDLGIDTHQVAISKLMEQEEQNRLTNERLLDFRQSPNSDVASIFLAAARKSAKVLGKFRCDWFLDGLRFGPGSTTSLKLHEATMASKLSGKPHVTPSAFQLASLVLSESPAWAYTIDRELDWNRILERCSWDRVTCVPKNALTDRTIAVQPDMNVMLQLATAYVMRKKLHRWGINLNHQSVNQHRARLASLDGKLATIDLSNASNSVTCSLVWKMIGDHPVTDHSTFDPTWYALLERLRTERGKMDDGTVHEYELFSAMGNGCTFELESLIFWAITTACCEHLGLEPDVTVYGDDIICPSEVVPLLEQVLSYAGFSFNEKKSFWNTEGPFFRESCGVHWLNGIDVTPFYIEDRLDTPQSVILLANNIVRWARIGDWGLDGRVKPVYDWVVSHLPRRLQKTAVPFGDSDDGLIKNFDQAVPSVVRAKYGDVTPEGARCLPFSFIGYRARTYSVRKRGKLVGGQVGLTIWLYGKSFHKFSWPGDISPYAWAEPYEPYRTFSRKQEGVFGSRVVASWTDPGPWIPPESGDHIG